MSRSHSAGPAFTNLGNEVEHKSTVERRKIDGFG